MMIIITTTTTAMTLIYGDNNYIPRIVEENANSQHVVCHAQLDFLSLFVLPPYHHVPTNDHF